MTNGPTGRRLDPSKHGSTFPVTRESQNQTFRTIGFAVLVPYAKLTGKTRGVSAEPD